MREVLPSEQVLQSVPGLPEQEGFVSVLNERFVYKLGSDVQVTWRKYGWIPPSEYREDFEFKKNREGK
jgi:hypothetical protein